VYAIFIIAVLSPIAAHILKRSHADKIESIPLPFPRWGWWGLFLCAAAWTLAWTRFSWFAIFQPHTFTPLWLGYIVTLNALTYRRLGRCPILDQPLRFLLLFPASSAFWWFFEYLNRYVQNWHYVGPELSDLEYFLYATLSFSTVLPAFASTREWLLSHPSIVQRFRGFAPIHVPWPRLVAALTLLMAGIGLFFLGIVPHHLLALLWISPLVILVSFQALLGEDHLFKALPQGNWAIILSSALASLMCGFFWEMWNYWSLAKWIYRIPFVYRFQIFEMPLLGYAGYLPFGVECAVIVSLLLPLPRSKV
jgi:hypothetical protein